MKSWYWAVASGLACAAGAALTAESSRADPPAPVTRTGVPETQNARPEGPPFAIRNGEVGMIVSSIAYGLGPDAEQSHSCPQGMSMSFIEGYSATHVDAGIQPGESERDHGRRLFTAASQAPTGENLCTNPNAAADPHFRTMSDRNVPTTGGLDLDGQDSHSNRRAAPGTCAHDDFRTADGSRGIDNQYFRVVGCTNSYQSRGAANSFEIEMLTGSWAILIDLKGVDNLRNDPDVIVGLHASADPIQVSAARAPLAHGSYAIDTDPRFRATAHGRIVNGVLTTDPVDARFRWSVNGMRLERPLRAARLRLTFGSGPSGPQAEGYLSGYTPIQEAYDNNVGFSAGRDRQGNPSPRQLILGTSVGAANVLGYTCNGMYHALRQYADGDRDPRTGQCTSISTQYRIRAIPAFIVNG